MVKTSVSYPAFHSCSRAARMARELDASTNKIALIYDTFSEIPQENNKGLSTYPTKIGPLELVINLISRTSNLTLKFN